MQCGASGRLASCIDLFHSLLALDHQRLQPWGSYHGLNVACFGLQHPSGASEKVLNGQREMVMTFLADGLDAVHAREAALVRANRHGKQRLRKAGPPPAVLPATPSHGPAVTIEDVAVDGTFPADGYEQRMHAWARSIADDRR